MTFLALSRAIATDLSKRIREEVWKPASYDEILETYHKRLVQAARMPGVAEAHYWPPEDDDPLGQRRGC